MTIHGYKLYNTIAALGQHAAKNRRNIVSFLEGGSVFIWWVTQPLLSLTKHAILALCGFDRPMQLLANILDL